MIINEIHILLNQNILENSQYTQNYFLLIFNTKKLLKTRKTCLLIYLNMYMLTSNSLSLGSTNTSIIPKTKIKFQIFF